MEKESKCKYLGKYLGSVEGLPGPWPFFACDAPRDIAPSRVGIMTINKEKKEFCRVATSYQKNCSEYDPLDK